tara:strand:+ start:43 stop:552 length:510 start_codon:yes stop_codon:yes gene_type:complete
VSKKNLVHIGTFGKPLGLKGDIKIDIFTSSIKSFKTLKPYLDQNGKNTWLFNFLKNYKGKLVGNLINYNSRNLIESLRGEKIYTKEKNLSKEDYKLFYLKKLINFDVKNFQNKFLGKVLRIDNFGAGDLIYLKKNNGKSYYIPMNSENIVKIDNDKKIIIVNPIKGIIY